MEDLRKPLFIAFITVSALAMLGAAIGWFDISNEFVRKAVESELAKKQTLAIGLSTSSIFTCILAAKLSKHRLAFLATIASIYQLIMVVNQKPDDAIASQIGISLSAGYYMSILGTLAMILLSGIIGAKGFSALVNKKYSVKD